MQGEFPSERRRIVLQVGAMLVVLAIGAAGGLWVATLMGWVDQAGQHEEEAEHAEDEEHHDHVALTEAAYRNLQVRIAPVERSAYTHDLMVPGELIERPGSGHRAASAPVTGVISLVVAHIGQTVSEGEALFQLRITDDELADAQVDLLETLTRLDVIDAEVKRLEPLVQQGAVMGKRKLELEYERQQLLARRDIRQQELALRGLDDQQVGALLQDRRLIDQTTISIPPVDGAVARSASVAPSRPGSERNETLTATAITGRAQGEMPIQYVVESISTYPGKIVQRGDELCHLVDHTLLTIQAHAFEMDMDAVTRAKQDRLPITAVFGEEQHELIRTGLQIQYVDSHLDTDTQTLLFYVPLQNEMLSEYRDDSGRLFRTWQFKVGQRVHLRIPTRTWNDQFVLPLDAIVQEGPNVYIFRQHHEEATGAEPGREQADPPPSDIAHDHAEEDIFIEFEPVAVELLHRDDRVAVVSQQGELAAGDVIAMTAAYQLYLALKMQAAGGHGHEHHHHDH